MAFVLIANTLCRINCVDRSGKHGTTEYYLAAADSDPAAGGPAALGDAVQGLSNDKVVSVETIKAAYEDDPGDPEDGPYCRPADKAKLTFKSADGSNVLMEIGAPKATIFQSDAITVDKDFTAMVDLIAYMKLHCVDAEGVALTAYQAGYRRQPAHRKSH